MEHFAELFQAFSGNVLFYVAALLATLFAVILVHELGHYFAARLCGVRTEVFSLGFGRELFGLTDKRGTRWVVSMFPVGGYVKIFGDVDPANPLVWDAEAKARRAMSADETHVAFYLKPLWQRTLIVLAGPAANFLLTFAILFFVFAVKGEVSTPPVVTVVTKNTAAEEAGFKPYDKIIAMDGKKIARFEDVWARTFTKTGVPYHFTIERGGRSIELAAESRPIKYRDHLGMAREHGQMGATFINQIKLSEVTSIEGRKLPRDPVEAEAKAREILKEYIGKPVLIGTGFDSDRKEYVYHTKLRADYNPGLGATGEKVPESVFFYPPDDVLYHQHSPLGALGVAAEKTWAMMDAFFGVMEAIFSGHARQGGIAGIGKMASDAGEAAGEGWYTFMIFIAAFSAQIAFLNLLPIPALDGGYLVFFGYEAAAGKPLPEAVKTSALYLGLAFLLGIIIIANISDVFRLTNP